MEEKGKGFEEKLYLEDLETVGGGFNVGKITIMGRPWNHRQVHAPSMGAGAGTGVPGLKTTPSISVPDGSENDGTVEAECSNCGMKTPHMVFSGGRSICLICKNWLDKV